MTPFEGSQGDSAAPAEPRVLVADDSASAALLVSRVLQQAGCRVDIVGDGLAAIDAVDAARYDLIVLDLEMPWMSGLAAAEAIRSQEHRRGYDRTPIVLLTGDEDPSLPARCGALGIDECLPKSRESLSKLGGFIRRPAEPGPPPGGSATPGREFEELLPAYLREVQSLAEALPALVEASRFHEIERIAHLFHGSGAAYGMTGLSLLGRQLEGASRERDLGRVRELCARVRDFLDSALTA